jgi:hypothetical protein
MTISKKHPLLCWLILSFPLASFGQDPNSLCCNGLAGPSANSVNLPMISKFALDVRQECPSGRGVRAISFHHNNGQDLIYQESFGLQCATSQAIVTAQCDWSPLMSNFEVRTMANAPSGWAVSGIRFTHKKDENFVYQQNFSIKSCRLQNSKSVYLKGSAGTTKWHLDSDASCERIYGGVTYGLVSGLGFAHDKDLNNTSQESVKLACLTDAR